MGSLFIGIFSTLCYCELNSSNIYNQTLSYNEADGTITYKATFVYSNADGSSTASNLAALSDQWITGLRDVDGVTYDIINPSTLVKKKVRL